MTILLFAVHLLSAATVLLFAVRFMRVGIERLWSDRIRASFGRRVSVGGLLARGVGLGFAMQGATAVLLMASGLAGSGTIPVMSAAVIGLGADLGSALAVVFLHLPVAELGPLAVLVGGSLYLRSSSPRIRNVGRVLLGLGLVFLSLALMRMAVAPLNDVAAVADIVAYLDRDPVTAALFGVTVTLIMHSSLAAILTAIAYATSVTVGPLAGIGFVLGCNLGSALLPLWLLRGDADRSVLVARTVALVRIALAVPAIAVLAMAGKTVANIATVETGLAMLVAHIAFNAALFGFAPFTGRLIGLVERAAPHQAPATGFDIPARIAGKAEFVVPAMKRQVNAMLELLASMFETAVSGNPDATVMADLERRMNHTLATTRQVYAAAPDEDAEVPDEVRRIIELAIRIERCGDLLAGKFLQLRSSEVQGEYRFSEEGKREIDELVEAVRQGVLLAQETIWTGRSDVARRLVEHKQNVTSLERASRDLHLRRVRHGNPTSLASSNQHLEVIAALKEVNSKLCTIGYAVLDQQGELRTSRLKTASSMQAGGAS